MKVEPSSAELLEIARATILSEIAPALPEGRAMPRSWPPTRSPSRAATSRLPMRAPASSRAWRPCSPAWNPAQKRPPRCARPPRASPRPSARAAFDEGEARAGLLAHLRQTVRERLAVSNPRALARDERTPT